MNYSPSDPKAVKKPKESPYQALGDLTAGEEGGILAQLDQVMVRKWIGVVRDVVILIVGVTKEANPDRVAEGG